MPENRSNANVPAARPAGRLAPAVVLAVAVAVGLVSLRAFSRSFVYLPWRWSEAEARRWNPGYEDVFFSSPDGVRLHGWLHRGARAGTAVLVCHGNAGHLGVQEGLLAPWRRLGVTALLFDYRGYGLSEGKPDEEGIALDAVAAFDRLAEIAALPHRRLLLHGKSLGAVAAVRAAIARGAAGVILESAFTSAVELGRHHYPFLPVGWLLADRLEVTQRLRALDLPVLLLHGGRDDIVPVSHARALAAANARARLAIFPDSGHNDTFEAAPEAYLRELERFVESAGEEAPRP